MFRLINNRYYEQQIQMLKSLKQSSNPAMMILLCSLLADLGLFFTPYRLLDGLSHYLISLIVDLFFLQPFCPLLVTVGWLLVARGKPENLKLKNLRCKVKAYLKRNIRKRCTLVLFFCLSPGSFTFILWLSCRGVRCRGVMQHNVDVKAELGSHHSVVTKYQSIPAKLWFLQPFEYAPY